MVLDGIATFFVTVFGILAVAAIVMPVIIGLGERYYTTYLEWVLDKMGV